MPDDFLLLPRIVNGGIAGIIAATTVYPIDLVKTRLQTQIAFANHGHGATPPMYTSMMNAFVKIRRVEGLRALYRGLAISLVFITPELAMKLSSNDAFRYLLRPEAGRLSIGRQVAASAGAGAVTVFLTTPVELLKIQLQEMGGVRPHLTARTIVQRVVREHGIAGLYRGLTMCAMRDVPFAIIMFPTFAFLYDVGPKRADGEASHYWTLICGLISGAISAVVVTPVDLVKTRLQCSIPHLSCHLHPAEQYDGIVDCMRKIYRHEGALAFFRGGACRVFAIAPFFGVTQMVYYVGVAEFLFGVRTQKIVR